VCHSAKFLETIGQIVADIWRLVDFSQNGGRPPSWIWCRRVGTTHEEHLAVFIIVQDLVGIDAEVLIAKTRRWLDCLFL